MENNVKPAHEKLWIWQKAHKLHLEICQICKSFPKQEQFRLIDQIERSSKSVKDNIAEANGSYYFGEKQRGFLIARREACETQNHLRDIEDKKYFHGENAQKMINEYEEIIRGINGMLRTIRTRMELNKT